MKRIIQGDYRGQSTLLPAKRAKRGQIYFFLNKSVPIFVPLFSSGRCYFQLNNTVPVAIYLLNSQANLPRSFFGLRPFRIT